jgi:hypothetical protein
LNFYNLSGVFIQQTKLMKSNGASNWSFPQRL